MAIVLVDDGVIFGGCERVEPKEIIAGDSVQWSVTLDNYQPANWTLTYAIKGQSALNVIALATGSSNTDYGILIAASQSAALVEGVYEFAAQVTSGSFATTVRSGRINVKPNLMTATAGARVSHIETMLASILAVLEGRVTNDTQIFTIAGRSVTQIPVAELMVLRATYARELFYLRHGKSGIGKNVDVHFTSPVTQIFRSV